MNKLDTSHIPNKPGVYIFKNGRGTVLYIGKAKDLKKRVNQYFAPGSVWKQDMINKANHVEFLEVHTESEALYLEDNLIKKYQPEYNRLLKADNSYIFIKLTKEDFPQVVLTRNRKNDGATYIGPKHNSKILRKLLHYLRQIYKFRVDGKNKFNKGEITSEFHFGLDAGRSIFAKLNQKNASEYIEKAEKVGLVVNKTYDEYKAEYKKIMQQLTKFFDGNTRVVTKDLKSKLQECINAENFEYAAILRDIYIHIEQITERQNVVLDPSISGKIIWITTIHSHHLFVMINFFEGKIIDIVRQKYSTNDRSYNQLITASENDFGSMKVFEYKDNDFEYIEDRNSLEQDQTHSYLLISSSMKKIKKTQRAAIHELMEKFIDSYLASDSFREHSLLNELLQKLQKKYNLTSFPYSIECVDISHLSGGRISGGLSHFQGGIPMKKGYRRYKIQSVKKSNESSGYNNDYKSLKEIIIRRFLIKKSENTGKNVDNKVSINLPNLFIIDGGKGQLGIIKDLLKKYPELKEIMKETQFVSLGKGEARHSKGKNSGAQEILYSFDKDFKIIGTPLNYDQTDKILIKIRDEAHRFANNYRKKQMSSERKIK